MDAFELRMWDSRLARWTSTDPYGQYHSPYLGMGNNPVSSVDPDGGFNWANAAIGIGIGAGLGYGGAALAGVPKEDRWKYAVGGAVAGGAVGGFWGQNIGNLFRKDTPWNAKYSKLNKAAPTNWQFDGTKLVRESFDISINWTNANVVSLVEGAYSAYTNAPQDRNGSATGQSGSINDFTEDAMGPIDFRVTSFSSSVDNTDVSNNHHAPTNGSYHFDFNSGQSGNLGSESATLMGGQTRSFNNRFTSDISRRFTTTRSPMNFNIQPNGGCACYDGKMRIQVRKRVPVK